MDGRIDAPLRLSLTARITNYAGTIDTGFLDLDNWNESIFCLFWWLAVCNDPQP